MKKLPIGRSDFKGLIEDNFYFVDKSLFIKEIIDEDSQIILLPRPRRFGKTLNLTMLRHFFEKTDEKEEIKRLFSGLSIEKEDHFGEHLCRYPVIYLTFKNIKSSKFEKDLEAIELLMANEFERHDYLLESDAITKIQKKHLKML